MNNTFASDFKNARLESGLTQGDCALLVGVSPSRISGFENGKITPRLREICAISLLFNRSFESLFNDIFDEVKAHMAASFDSLREDDADSHNFHRKDSLERLRDRLMDYNLALLRLIVDFSKVLIEIGFLASWERFANPACGANRDNSPDIWWQRR